MARQNRTTKPNTDTATEAVETPNEENTVSTTTVEAPEAPETVTETVTETPTPEVVDLAPFEAVVNEALVEADDTTGELPVTAIEKVNGVYRTLEGNKAKRAARDFLQNQMLEAVGKLDAVKARSYSDLSAKLSAAGSTKAADKAPADPAAAFVQRAASLRLALNIVAAEAPEVEGRDLDGEVRKAVEDVSEQVTAYREWLNAETPEGTEKPAAPEVSPIVRLAFKAATGKATGAARTSGGGLSGPRRDTAKHILSAFANEEVGKFLTIAEIAKHKSEEYGDASPSQGAISARLFPTTTIEGVEPVEKGAIDGKNPKGARKIQA